MNERDPKEDGSSQEESKGNPKDEAPKTATETAAAEDEGSTDPPGTLRRSKRALIKHPVAGSKENLMPTARRNALKKQQEEEAKAKSLAAASENAEPPVEDVVDMTLDTSSSTNSPPTPLPNKPASPPLSTAEDVSMEQTEEAQQSTDAASTKQTEGAQQSTDAATTKQTEEAQQPTDGANSQQTEEAQQVVAEALSLEEVLAENIFAGIEGLDVEEAQSPVDETGEAQKASPHNPSEVVTHILRNPLPPLRQRKMQAWSKLRRHNRPLMMLA